LPEVAFESDRPCKTQFVVDAVVPFQPPGLAQLALEDAVQTAARASPARIAATTAQAATTAASTRALTQRQ
jgi:hypothetical protein